MLSTKRRRIRQLEMCKREMFGDLVVTYQNPLQNRKSSPIITTQTTPEPSLISIMSSESLINNSRRSSHEAPIFNENDRRRASVLVDQLLTDIYNKSNNNSDYNSATSSKRSSLIEIDNLNGKDTEELSTLVSYLEFHVERSGNILVKQLKRRDALRRQQDAHCDVITSRLLHRAPKNCEGIHFSIQPGPGESGFTQWAAAMKMVSQLAGGIPPEFRRRLWLTLADRHLTTKGVNWSLVDRNCFSEWSHPTDSELGVQIVKDLHRTGCSLFCGEDGQENQALLKRVLLAYARWNKAVGYCQGFNMLAALILQVTDKCETDALKLMIFLIEGVLPDSYFADSLRGLSVDMAVFRELLRTRLPRLSKHLDTLQSASKDGISSYEPPLTNVFTMQWFLTLFCNCLPQPTVLRVWDLILLEGNEILLRTALAIWQTLEDRILGVRNADEFYCMMGVLTRELLEFSLIDANTLIKTMVAIGPLSELKNLREHYLYNINPWGTPIPPNIYEKQLKMYPKERLVLDISALKKQYAKLKQRQRQAHIIFSAAISRQPPPSAPVAMNHLLLGKSALIPAKRLGPPKGAIPPARVPPSTLLWKDAPRSGSPANSSSSSDTELCDPSESSSSEDEDNEKPQETEKDEEEPKSITVEDNLAKDLMTTASIQKTTIDDNIQELQVRDAECTESCSVIEDEQVSKKDCDIFVKDIFESDDDSVDFDKFLEDRVRCLKTVSSPLPSPPSTTKTDATIEEIGKKFVRRNSVRALQIIQENSMILHRIMQCQSRLSPPLTTIDVRAETPPPPKEGDHQAGIVDDNLDTLDKFDPLSPIHQTARCSPYSWENSPISSPQTSVVPEIEPETLDKSPEYGSRYTSILEKSRNLDEKYNNLILNASVKHFPLSEDILDVNSTISSMTKENVSPKISPLVEQSGECSTTENFMPPRSTPEKWEFESAAKKETLTLELGGSTASLSPLSEIKGFTGTLLSPNTVDGTSYPTSPCLEEYSSSPRNERKSPKSPTLDSSLKSPNKVFNPFPISLSSRQNKEVPFKLGLYKK